MLGGVNVLCPPNEINAYIQNESMNEMGFFKSLDTIFFTIGEDHKQYV